MRWNRKLTEDEQKQPAKEALEKYRARLTGYRRYAATLLRWYIALRLTRLSGLCLNLAAVFFRWSDRAYPTFGPLPKNNQLVN